MKNNCFSKKLLRRVMFSIFAMSSLIEDSWIFISAPVLRHDLSQYCVASGEHSMEKM